MFSKVYKDLTKNEPFLSTYTAGLKGETAVQPNSQVFIRLDNFNFTYYKFSKCIYHKGLISFLISSECLATRTAQRAEVIMTSAATQEVCGRVLISSPGKARTPCTKIHSNPQLFATCHPLSPCFLSLSSAAPSNEGKKPTNKI